MKLDKLKFVEKKKIIIFTTVFAILLCISITGLAFSIFKEISQSKSILGFEFVPNLGSKPQSTALPGQTEEPVFAPQIPTAEPWNGNDRVTLLLLGLDHRDWDTQEKASRSDTMILLTIDPISKEAGMLSVPRDLWANIPGFDPGKINTAYYLGDIYKLPGGGPKLAIETVENTIGVPIDYYAQIDFSTFERFVDLIGGLKMDIKSPITIDPLGPKSPITLDTGIQVLPGYLALAYARTRSTEGGDFTRAERQQEIILAIRNRFLEPGGYARIMGNAKDIYSELSSGINTNLPFEDALKLIILAAQVDFSNIKSGVINEKYVNFGTSPKGSSILIPIPDLIRTLRNEIFSSGGSFSPLTDGDTETRMNLENSNIYIQNASNVPGLEQQTADYLRSFGANINNIDAGSQFYYVTTIIDYSGSPYTLQYLKTLIGDQINIYHRYDPNSTYDVEIYLGYDWANNNPMP